MLALITTGSDDIIQIGSFQEMNYVKSVGFYFGGLKVSAVSHVTNNERKNGRELEHCG